MQDRNGGGGRGSVLAKGERAHPLDVFKNELKQRTGELTLLIPRRIRREFPPQRIIVVAARGYMTMLDNVRGDAPPPDIYSTIDAVMRMAQLGLEAGTEQAYLVPYKGKVQAIVGPRGYADLFLRHPKGRSCTARAVIEGDNFTYNLGTNRIDHTKGRRPVKQDDRAASVEYAYATYETTTGGREIEVLTREDIEYYRSHSAARNSGPWVTAYEGMACKTALKRVLRYAPRDTFLSLAMCEDSDGAYDPKLSLEDTREIIDAGDGSVSVQVPAAQEPAPVERQAPGREPGEDG